MARKKKEKENLGYGRYRFEDFEPTEGGYSKNRYTFGEFQKKLKEDEQNKRFNEYLEKLNKEKREREESIAKTRSWQKAYNDAKYGPDGDQSWQVYAAKMIQDTPGAAEKEKKRADRLQAQANQYWRNLSREAMNAGAPEVAYAAKMINDTPVSRADISKYDSSAKAKQAKLNEFLTGLTKKKAEEKYGKEAGNAYDIATGTMPVSEWWGETPKETREALKTKNAKESAEAIRKMREGGEFDEEQDISLWSDAKRSSEKAALQAKASAYKKQVEELKKQISENQDKGNGWDPIVDLYTSEEVERLRDIIYDRDFSEEERNNGEAHSREEKQKARDQLNLILTRNAGIGSMSVTDSAKNFYKYNQNNLTTLKDSMNMDRMRQMAYDSVNGQGAYEQITKGMGFQQKKELDERIEKALYNISYENGELGKELNDVQAYLDITNDKIKQIDYFNGVDQRVEDLMTGYNVGDTQIHPENITEQAEQAAMPSYSRKRPHGETGGIVNPVDSVYAVLGGYGINDDQSIVSVEYHNAVLMDSIKNENGLSAQDIFISLYNENKKDEAWAFYQGLQPTLNQMYNYYEKLNQEDTAMKLPVLSSVATVLMSPAQTIEYISNILGRIEALVTGKQNAQSDPFSGAYATTRAKNTTRNKITKELKDWGWLYSGTMSGLDSAFNAAIGKGIGLTGNAAQYGVLALFGTQAFETSLQNNMETGNNNFAYDWIEAYIDAAIETATEIWSVENWLGDPKNILTYVGKLAISEPSEEFVGAVVEPYIKELLGHKNEYKERAKEILANGGYYDSEGNLVEVKDIDTATRQAMREWNHNIRMAAQEALLSVGPAMVYGSGQIAAQNMSMGKAINSSNANGENNATKALAEAAGKMVGTESEKQGTKILDLLSKGKKVSNYKTGALAQTMQAEALETLNKEDATPEEVKKSVETMRSVAEAMGQRTNSTRDIGSRMASQQEIEEAEGERIQGQREAIYTDPKTGKATITKIDGVKLTQDKNNQWHLGIQVTVNGEQRTVAPSELRMTNYQASEIINKAAAFPEFYSEGYTNLLLDAAEKGQISEEQLTQAMNDAAMVRLYAYAGFLNTELPKTSLSQEMANSIWKQSAEEHGTNRKGQVEGANRQEVGRATFDGVEYGTEEYKQKVAGLKLSKQTQEWMDTVAGIVQRAGIRADFTIADDDMTYGWESPEGIGLNISGMNYELDKNGKPKRTGQKHHLLVTFGHEMTHWLQRNSMQGYNRLEQYVLKSYINDHSAEELMHLLNNKMNRGEMLSLEDAISEFVANSCDQILGSEQVRDHIAKTDGKLFSQIKGFVKDLVNRFKNAIKGMDASASYEAQQMASRMNELAKIWLGAYDEALSEVIQQGKETNNTIRKSKWVIDENITQNDLTNTYKQFTTIAQKYIRQNYSVKDDIDPSILIKHFRNDEMAAALVQWLHNVYEKYDKTVTRSEIETFLQSDYEKLKKGSAGIVEGWKDLLNGEDIKPVNVIKVQALGGKLRAKTKSISEQLFGKSNKKNVWVEDTNTTIRIDGDTIDKSIIYNDEHGIQWQTVEKVLRKADDLLSGSKYIGSHVNYEFPQGKVHYYANAVKVEELNKATKKKETNTHAVVFAVHDPVDTQQKKAFSERAYVAEIMLTKKGGNQNPLNPVLPGRQALRSAMPSTSIIQNVLNSVNAERIREFNKERLNDNKTIRKSRYLVPNEKGYWSDMNEVIRNGGKYYVLDHRTNEQTELEGTDREYAEAWFKGDRARMEEILMEKIQEAGAVPIKFAEWYNNALHRWVADEIKNGDPKAIAYAAAEMAEKVPKNAVLVPMPDRTGKVTETTDTMLLAKAISEKTGNQVINALEGVDRESRQADKSKPKNKQMTAKDLGFRQVAEIPDGMIPYFIDNLIAAGVTAKAAHDAFGTGVTLAYAKGERSGDQGIKDAEPTFYDRVHNGQYLIPLHERIDMDRKGVKGVRFSKAQLDTQYDKAVKSGDEIMQQALVETAAEEAGYTIKAYHGTPEGGFTVFNTDKVENGRVYGNGIYYTSDKNEANLYASKTGKNPQVYGSYLNLGNNPLVIDYDEIREKVGDNKHYIWNEVRELYKAEFNDATAIVIKHRDKNNPDKTMYVLKDSSQVKSADPVTYDDKGEVIPPSERFNSDKNDIRWSRANIEAEGDEMTLDPLNIRRDIYFKGTNEEIDAAERQIEQREKELKSIIEAPDFTALMLKNKPAGRYEILHPSTRKGIRYQLTYYGPDGIPSMHESYGKTGGQVDENETVHSMDELYRHFSNQNFDSKLEMNVLRENQQGKTRNSRAQLDNDPKLDELRKAYLDASEKASELRAKRQDMKPELDAWTKRLIEASEQEGGMDALMPEYKEWEKGYNQLGEELYEAERAYREANKAFDDYIEERDVAEEQEKIKASGLSEADYRRKQAVEEFGYTTDFREAGYLLPNGKMLNFTGEKGKHYGTRGEDHRGIGRIYASRENQGGAAMMAFMRDGNIRVMAETPGIDLITTIEPTAEQYEQIRNMVRRFAGEHYFNVDLTDERGYTDDSIEYDGRVDPNRVVNDIKSYYRTGVVPTQSTVSQFHYSKWTEDAMDVSAWMANATASTVQTEDERILLDAFRGMRIKMSLSLKKQMDYKAKIRQLEEKANLTTEQKNELTALRNRLEIEQNKYARLEDEMFKVTSADGWAGMMYRENMLLKDYLQGKTQDQVRQTVEEMLKLVQKTQAEIEKDTADLKKLAEAQAVKTMKSYLGKTSLGRAAATLRKTYNSTMAKAEIENRLAEIALKKASGQDITSDTELLAQDILDKMRGIRSDALENLRGTTLVIGQSLADELKAENSSIKELQSRLKGSGVRIVTGRKTTGADGAQTVDKHSRISEQWAELREKDQSLPDVDGMAEIDKLHTIVDFIESELKASTGAEQFNIDFDEVAAMVRAQASMVTTYLVDDPKARAQIENLMKQIKELSQRTEKTAEGMERLYQQLDDVVLAGQKAKGWTTILQRDVNEAIRYYNKTAKVAAETERNRVRKELIEKLKSDHAKDLIKQQEKFREQIANDKKARELQQDNLALRSKISTVATRLANRIFGETDQKNIPEEAKAMVRQVLDMISRHDTRGEDDGFLRKVTYWDKQQVDDVRLRLMKMMAANGKFDPDTDLDFLVIKAADPADNDYSVRDKVEQDLIDIETGLLEYRNAEGQGRISLADRKAALEKVQKALSEIWDVVRARSEAFINGKRYELAELAMQMENEMAGSKFKGERTGKIGRAFDGVSKAVGYGNLTPEYFFKNLKNGVINLLHRGFHDAEQRAGLEALRAKAVIGQIAKETGFNTWDGQEKHKVKTRSGEIEMTTEQIMALYATWLRESNQLRPEDTAHLLHGGFVLAQNDQSEGVYGRQKNNQRPIRMSKDSLNALGSYLTDEQKEYVNRIVGYMSGELAELGNETSMQTYGIKKFTEQFYFPIKSWGGVLSKKSDAGVTNKSDNRSMRQSFTKRVKANASNAIEIGDFTPTAMKHIVGMITFNTVGPAVENLNRVLNQQLTYGDVSYSEDGEIEEDDRYKKSIRAAFQDAYGVNALHYMERFMEDVNGGMTRRMDRSIQEKLLSVFRKGAVAGSLSVAAQQPLSYIRAAVKINPVYLARALAPTHWGKIHDEMLKYSGLAVIKDMGRFDMNQGQSMTDFITPEEKISKARRIGQKAVDATTILPEKMDALTWGRMWIACKLETAAQNKGMDQKSEAFLQKVAERFNEVMRTTQVYDSMMVKSQNMRSQNYALKAMTSFMAEPTLSLNVLADAVQNFNTKGGKANMWKAAGTFVISAALQALVKAIMSSGRSPDKKKKFEEQFLTKWHSMFISEVDPLTLIPGYSDIIELLKNGELADDAWSALGKLKTIMQTGIKWATGKSDDHYRNFEDTVGQMAQLFTNVPLKNLMRDSRAIYNFFNPDTYAKREYSSAMTEYGIKDSFYSADNMIGLVNSYLQMADAGYGTSADAYYQRIYDAEKTGNKQDAEDMREYLTLKSTAKDPEKAIENKMKTLAKNDDSLTYSEKIQALKDRGMTASSIASWILSEYKDGKLEKEEAEKLWLQANPGKTEKDAYFKFEQAEWEGETGEDVSDTDWFRLNAAIDSGKDADYQSAVKELTTHGYQEKEINDHVKGQITKKYKDGSWTRQQTETALKKYMKDLKADDIWWTLDRIDYNKETGKDAGSGQYYRLYDAFDANKSDSIRAAVQTMLKHGMKKENIKKQLTTKYKQEYLSAGTDGRRRIKDALDKAYKALGYTVADADKIVQGWVKDKKKTK